MRSNLNYKKVLLSAGFGLVELMVSISIVVLVTSIVMVRQSSYNGTTLLRSQAYSVALAAREVQLSAVSAIVVSGTFNNVLGLHFDTTLTPPNQYPTFKDADGDHFYDSSEQVGKKNLLDKRFEIDSLRLVNGSTIVSTENDVSVVFERPNFDARFFTASGVEASASVSALEIDIRLKGTAGNTNNEVRTVEISKTGQITVQ